MLAFYTYDLSTVLLLVLLGAAMWIDIRTHKIPNKLNLFILTLGLSLQTWFLGLDGLVSGLLGLIVGFAVFIPFYLLKGFSAGDVKLMAVVGTFLGPQDTLIAAALTLIAGGVIGGIILLARHGFIAYLSRNWQTLKTFLLTRQFIFLRPGTDEAAAMRFPYAAAIAAGTFAAMLWLGLMEFTGLRELVALLIS